MLTYPAVDVLKINNLGYAVGEGLLIRGYYPSKVVAIKLDLKWVDDYKLGSCVDRQYHRILLRDSQFAIVDVQLKVQDRHDVRTQLRIN